MGFPCEIVGTIKQKINGRSHIKYADNMDLKVEIDGLDGQLTKK
jgi:hypothetical protein